MINLEPYKNHFPNAYPNYADGPYRNILELIDLIPKDEEVAEILSSADGQNTLALILPIVMIKNYKSQIPFPPNLSEVVVMITQIKNHDPDIGVQNGNVALFEQLINTTGFQLPTVSAVFHFSHPNAYPIVDKITTRACTRIHENHPDEFPNINAAPTLPAQMAGAAHKLECYRNFIEFLNVLKDAHNNQYQTDYNFRDLDKALMVYGVDALRQAVEHAE